LGRVDELADRTGGSVDAVTGAAIGPYREYRLTRLPVALAFPASLAYTPSHDARERACEIIPIAEPIL